MPNSRAHDHYGDFNWQLEIEGVTQDEAQQHSIEMTQGTLAAVRQEMPSDSFEFAAEATRSDPPPTDPIVIADIPHAPPQPQDDIAPEETPLGFTSDEGDNGAAYELKNVHVTSYSTSGSVDDGAEFQFRSAGDGSEFG